MLKRTISEKIIYRLNKKSRSYGVKFALALSQNLKMTLIQTIPPTMRLMKMLADCRICVQP